MDRPVEDFLPVYPKAGTRRVYRAALRAFLDHAHGRRREDRARVADDATLRKISLPGTSPMTATGPPT